MMGFRKSALRNASLFPISILPLLPILESLTMLISISIAKSFVAILLIFITTTLPLSNAPKTVAYSISLFLQILQITTANQSAPPLPIYFIILGFRKYALKTAVFSIVLSSQTCQIFNASQVALQVSSKISPIKGVNHALLAHMLMFCISTASLLLLNVAPAILGTRPLINAMNAIPCNSLLQLILLASIKSLNAMLDSLPLLCCINALSVLPHIFPNQIIPNAFPHLSIA